MKRWSIPVLAACGMVLAAAGCSGSAHGAEAPAPAESTGPEPAFSSRTLATGLENPWEITWGPDDMLWVTEKSAGRVTRVSPADGTKTTAVTIGDVLATPNSQDGLLGMALHPGLLKPGADQYVYVAYTYDADPASTVKRQAKIARYTYDQGTQQLGNPVDLITGLPASNDHNSGRLKYGPDGKLYYTIGDQGSGQFDNFCKPILSQLLPTKTQVEARDFSAYQGKILRLDPDGAIPADNPVLDGVRSHVYTYGHRNAQGIAFDPTGRLYSSEQGPKTDDEINLIESGRNYGWPRVVGAIDDKAYVYGDWSASTNPSCELLRYSDFVIPASVPTQAESTFNDPAFTPPLRSLYTVESDYVFENPDCAANFRYFICWPTIAPSSLEVYTSTAVPGWATSLLMPSLKDGVVYRLKLDESGNPIGEPSALWRTVNRYRDTTVSGDGQTFYVSTDKAGAAAKDLSGKPTNTLANPGAILEFRHSG
jgi:PQQ-dependent dehydrogenase (s-GDH family)